MNHSPKPWKVAGFAGEHDEAGARIVDSEGEKPLMLAVRKKTFMFGDRIVRP